MQYAELSLVKLKIMFFVGNIQNEVCDFAQKLQEIERKFVQKTIRQNIDKKITTYYNYIVS